MTKPIYNNGIDIYALDGIRRGFLFAVVDDAQHDLIDWDDSRIALEELTMPEYEELCQQSFDIDNISPKSFHNACGIVDEFIASLAPDKQQFLDKLTWELKIDFGIDLYYSLLYDRSIMAAKFRSDVAAFRYIS